MFLTKKAIPRRTFLRSAQAICPAATRRDDSRPRRGPTPAKPVRGSASCSSRWGAIRRDGHPRPGKARRAFTHPQPAQAGQDQVTVITNLRLPNAYPGTHDTSNSAFLSAATAKHTESSDYFLGTTVDQIAAKEMGRETQLASLQIAMDLNPLAGVCATTVTRASIRIASHGRRRRPRFRPRRIRESSSSACSARAAMRAHAAPRCAIGQACSIRSLRHRQVQAARGRSRSRAPGSVSR